MLPSCFSTWILSFSVCCQNSKEPTGMGLFAIRGQGCYELWPGFAWKPDQHFPVSELQVASTLTCIKPYSAGYECATFFSDLTASFLMTGTPVARSTSVVHSVTTAKLPPTRNDSTIASFSEATSWPSSTVPLPDVLSRKNRAVDGSAALVPRRRRDPTPFFPGEVFGSTMLLAAASVVAVAIALLLVESSRPAGPKGCRPGGCQI